MTTNSATMEPPRRHATRGASKREAFHQSREAERAPFSFRRPDGLDIPEKGIMRFTEGEYESVSVQILNDGGDNNLHYHPNTDTVWFVLKGRIRFYGPGDDVTGEYGANEGLVMPAGARYWFEKVGDEEAHLLQVAIHRKGLEKSKRIEVADRPRHQKRAMLIDSVTHEVIPR